MKKLAMILIMIGILSGCSCGIRGELEYAYDGHINQTLEEK